MGNKRIVTASTWAKEKTEAASKMGTFSGEERRVLDPCPLEEVQTCSNTLHK